MKKMILPLIIAIIFIGVGLWNCVAVVSEWRHPKTLGELEHLNGKILLAQEINSSQPRKLVFSIAGDKRQFTYDESVASLAPVQEQVIAGKPVDVWFDSKQCAAIGSGIICEVQQVAVSDKMLVARDDFIKIHQKKSCFIFAFYLALSLIGIILLLAVFKYMRKTTS